MTNRFEYLRHEEYPDASPCTSYSTDTITSRPDESIQLLTSEAAPGKWVAGYLVYWRNGRVSTLMPSLESGWFDSEREAKLYYLGFMSCYLDFFTEESRLSIREAINRYSQSTLFT